MATAQSYDMKMYMHDMKNNTEKPQIKNDKLIQGFMSKVRRQKYGI